ncbi:MAG: T9SS type A sorting domain-containing protein [Bacteroidota bacterium]
MEKLYRYYTSGIILLFFLSGQSAKGQSFIPAGNTLDIGNIRTHAWADGHLFHDTSEVQGYILPTAGFEFPKDTGRMLIHIGGMWVSGTRSLPSSTLGLGIHGWGPIQGSGRDFWPGPLTNQTALTDTNTVVAYNQVWKITRTQIDSFKADFLDNGVIDHPHLYPLVYNWPAIGADANGDTVRAVSADGCTFYLAPFVDVNGNPTDYNPDQGDHPRMQGDEMLWWVFNDIGPGSDRYSTSSGMGLEFHVSMYAYDQPTELLSNGLYVDYVMINRSSHSWEDVRWGSWTDLGIGNPFDDFAGVDSLNHMIIGYNANNTDDTTGNSDLAYPGIAPAVGIKILGGPLADLNDGVDNDRDGQIDEIGEQIGLSNFSLYQNDFTPYGNPDGNDSLHQYVTYLHSQDKTGTSFVDNYANGGDGDGRAANSPGPATNFPFSGDVCSSTGWTMSNASMTPTDYRLLGVMGPFTLSPGEVNQASLLYAAAQDDADHIGSVCELYPTMDSLLFYYEAPVLGCAPANLVYPGDTDHDQIANAWDLLPIGVTYGSSGPLRPNATTTWLGQAADAWGDSLANGVDIKHVDSNGDGMIDAQDKEAISLNYALQHTSQKTSDSNGVPLLADFSPGPYTPGDSIHVQIKLGNMDTLAQDIYGIAFSVSYDTSLVSPDGLEVSFSSSWIGTEGSDLLTLSHNQFDKGQIDIAEVRIDQTDVSGFGQIASMIVVLDDDIAKKDMEFSLHIQGDARLINAKEELVPMRLQTTQANVSTTKVSSLHVQELDIFPNPASQVVMIQSSKTKIKAVSLWDLSGKRLYQTSVRNGSDPTQLDVSFYANGLYILRIETQDGIISSKLHIFH